MIDSHFPLAPFWALSSLVNEVSTPQGELVSLDRIEGKTGRLLQGGGESNANGRQFRKDDVLFGKLRPYLAKYWLADRPGTAQGDIHVYRPTLRTDPRFLAYIVGSDYFTGLANTSSTGSKMPRVEWPKVAQFRVPFPPRRTQRAIADYLDRETAEIDAMTADLDELEVLLVERRVASFNRAIRGRTTREVEIGVAARLTTGSTPKGGGIKADETVSSGIPWIRPDDLLGKKTRPAIRLTESQATSVKVVPAGTPLVCGIGSIGKVGIVNEPCSTNQQITALVPNPGFDGDFLYRAIEASQDALVAAAPENVIPILNNLRLGMLKIPCLHFGEQKQVVEVVNRETAEIDAMLADITELRDLLAERRAALIAAAVTGQIDIPTAEEPTHA